MSKFTTKIYTSGADGNIFVVMSRATHMLSQLGIDQEEINALVEKVFESNSYEEALSHIEVYFPVVRNAEYQPSDEEV